MAIITQSDWEAMILAQIPETGEIAYNIFANRVREQDARALSIFHDMRRKQMFGAVVKVQDGNRVLMLSKGGN